MKGQCHHSLPVMLACTSVLNSWHRVHITLPHDVAPFVPTWQVTFLFLALQTHLHVTYAEHPHPGFLHQAHAPAKARSSVDPTPSQSGIISKESKAASSASTTGKSGAAGIKEGATGRSAAKLPGSTAASKDKPSSHSKLETLYQMQKGFKNGCVASNGMHLLTGSGFARIACKDHSYGRRAAGFKWIRKPCLSGVSNRSPQPHGQPLCRSALSHHAHAHAHAHAVRPKLSHIALHACPAATARMQARRQGEIKQFSQASIPATARDRHAWSQPWHGEALRCPRWACFGVMQCGLLSPACSWPLDWLRGPHGSSTNARAGRGRAQHGCSLGGIARTWPLLYAAVNVQ